VSNLDEILFGGIFLNTRCKVLPWFINFFFILSPQLEDFITTLAPMEPSVSMPTSSTTEREPWLHILSDVIAGEEAYDFTTDGDVTVCDGNISNRPTPRTRGKSCSLQKTYLFVVFLQ
jgi:hypothetical protein